MFAEHMVQVSFDEIRELQEELERVQQSAVTSKYVHLLPPFSVLQAN